MYNNSVQGAIMNKKIPKYTRKERNSSGEMMWIYKPPRKAVECGVVMPLTLEAERYISYKQIEEQNERLIKWQRTVSNMKVPTDKSTLHALFRFYQTTHSFNKLREQTKRDYRNLINSGMMTKIKSGRTLQNIKLGNLRRSDIKIAYENWLQKGVRTANITHSVLRKILNVAIEYDIITSNPSLGIEKQKELARKVVWTQKEVRLFLETAYSKWKWRNIGLITHMSYEWGQRVGDMRELKWSCINFDDETLTLEQSKRRSEVFLPISEGMLRMLKKQQEDFGFQQYVAPNVNAYKGKYRPYDRTQVATKASEIKNSCNLPLELQIMDMRRTKITEMVDAGVDITQIMSVSGHQNIQSVTPYVKHTLKSAKSAFSKTQSLIIW